MLPHQEERLKEAQMLLANVRIGYAAFCAAVLVAFRKAFAVPESVYDLGVGGGVTFFSSGRAVLNLACAKRRGLLRGSQRAGS